MLNAKFRQFLTFKIKWLWCCGEWGFFERGAESRFSARSEPAGHAVVQLPLLNVSDAGSEFSGFEFSRW